LAEELWHSLGHANTLAYEPWPVFDPALLVAEAIEVPVQVNGKIRARLIVAPNTDGTTLEAMALADEKVREHLGGKPPRKVVVVPGKLVNIVAG
jgi:leucyl-tRNA synthetase